MNAATLETPRTLTNFFKLWAFFIPITSILLIPTVQGTLPSYLLAFSSLLLVLFVNQYKVQLEGYLSELIMIIFVFILLSLISQLLNSFFTIPAFDRITLVDPDNPSKVVFRTTFFTQSLYLLSGILTFVFVKRYFTLSWEKYIFLGINFFVIYGLFEFIYYLAFNDFGDFLTNREYDDHETINLGNQLMTIGSVTFQRINSLALEPSMFAFTLLPFWIYSIFTKRKKTSILLFIGLCLSTSTSALVGIAFYFTSALKKSNKLLIFYLIGFSILFILLNYEFVFQLLDKIVLQKFNQQTESGIMRSYYFENHLDYFFSLNFFSMIFGIGFGYVRSTDFFTTLLINNGFIGVIIFTVLFFVPIFKLKNTYKNFGLKLSLFVIYLIMMISVPEYSFLSIWLFLGIAYNQLNRQKREAVL
ncbi:hypothetical protein FZC78_19110 [Rossellomorea vietnamensis]|uniref:O-antigen polymerase n=1 Tax=Rossellomorea vietnamensis TaxID=218284 RepID=A0A5D4NJM7_9BACI|nr:hypothetical protein [Rossellomorea vietnamensis]TYS14267.1 hypothetical protein FZC78_19110 [Rossellomorea vietnamensis]